VGAAIIGRRASAIEASMRYVRQVCILLAVLAKQACTRPQQ
jgi:hypothetical protein